DAAASYASVTLARGPQLAVPAGEGWSLPMLPRGSRRSLGRTAAGGSPHQGTRSCGPLEGVPDGGSMPDTLTLLSFLFLLAAGVVVTFRFLRVRAESIVPKRVSQTPVFVHLVP